MQETPHKNGRKPKNRGSPNRRVEEKEYHTQVFLSLQRISRLDGAMAMNCRNCSNPKNRKDTKKKEIRKS